MWSLNRSSKTSLSAASCSSRVRPLSFCHVSRGWHTLLHARARAPMHVVKTNHWSHADADADPVCAAALLAGRPMRLALNCVGGESAAALAACLG